MGSAFGNFTGRPRRSLEAGFVALLRDPAARGTPRELRPALEGLRAIFPSGVPIMQPVSHEGDLQPEKPEAARGAEQCYRLDIERCTELQLDQVAQFVAAQCGGGSAAIVLRALLAGVSMPLRSGLVAGVQILLRFIL